MNRCFIAVCIIFNIAVAVYIWRYFTFLKEVKLIQENLWTSSNPPPFIPTNEWQPIGRDQPIPPYLHVRINMQTGEREAKLLSSDTKEDDSQNELALVPVDEDENNSLNDNTRYELLKESLDKISDDASKIGDQNSQKTQKKFRTYEQLKEDMSQLNLNVKTDAEILYELIENFNKLQAGGEMNSEKEAKLLIILNDLEYLLHQVDNAAEFAKENGFADVIVPYLSSNSTEIRAAAARVLGSAVQNNAEVQISALKTGVIPPLLKNIAVHDDYEVRSSSTYALSCFVRNFPLAESKLIEEGGLSVLLSIFNENSDDSLKLQLKILTFFNDLLMERDDAALTVEENQLLPNSSDETTKQERSIMTEKLRQYNNVGLGTKLVERGWCSTLAHFLTDKVFKKPLTKNSDNKEINHDAVDKVLNAVTTVLPLCKTDFKNDERFGFVLEDLRSYYKNLSLGEEKDSFYADMFHTLEKLCESFRIT